MALQTDGGGCVEAAAVQDGGAYLVAGQAVQQLYRTLGADLADVLTFQAAGCTSSGTPIAACCLAAKADPAVRKAAAAAAAAADAAAAQRSAAGSPASPELLLPSQQQRQQQRQAPGSGAGAAGRHADEQEPLAPPTIANTDALAAAAPGSGNTASQGDAAEAEAAAVRSCPLLCCC